MSNFELGRADGKLATAFHESFALSNPALSQILNIASKLGTAVKNGQKVLTFDGIREGTTLGSNYVKSMRRYACGAGLLDNMERLSSFGRLALDHDSLLSDPATLWVMHYNLAADHLSGPPFWHDLVLRYFAPGMELTPEQIANDIGCSVASREAKELASRTLRSTATIFLGTYAKSDALGGLGILQLLKSSCYITCRPCVPSMWVVAYVVADYWRAHWGDRATVNLSAMTEPGGPASLLLLSSGDMNALLREMQNQQLVQIQRRVPPYQVVRLWDSPESILEHLYDSANA